MKHINELKLAAVVDESARLDRRERRHLEACPACEADITSFSQLRSSFAASRLELIEPGPELIDQVLAAVAADRGRFNLPNRRAVAGGLAVAAGLTGAVFFGRQKLGKAA